MKIFNAKNLSKEQKALVEVLEKNGDKWQYQQDIALKLGHYSFELFFHDTTERIRMTKNINYINHSPCYDKIILSGRKGIKLATEKEAKQFVQKKYRDAFKLLRYARVLEKKILKDNQSVLDIKDLDTHFIDAFIDKTKGE